MAVQSINNNNSRVSSFLTLGVAGAGIGAGVGYFSKPSVDSIVIAAKNTAVKNTTNDIKFLANVLKDIDKDGFKSLSKETKQALKEKGYSANLKSIRQGIINLTEEKMLFQGGTVYEKALKRLSKNTTAPKNLVKEAQQALTFKLSTAKEYFSLFQDIIINSLKTSASNDVKAEMAKITKKAIKNNTIKGSLIGTGVALGLGILSLIKPKKEYLLIKE